MSKLRIKSVSIETFSHETEDVSKVKQAMLHLVPDKIESIMNIKSSILKGYHGNSITKLSIIIKGNQALETFQFFLKSLENPKPFIDGIEDHFEGSHLHVRLDKQKLFQGIVQIKSRNPDPIKLVITVSIYGPKKSRLAVLLDYLRQENEKG